MIVCSGPAGSRDRQRGPFDEGLAEELRTFQAPVDPGGIAAALGDGRDTGVALHVGGGGIPFALLAEGGEESGAEDRAGSGDAVEDGEVRMRRRAFGDLSVEALDRLQRGSELLDEPADEEHVGGDHALVLGQRDGGLDRLDALVDEPGPAHIVLVEEALERGTAGLAGGFACPASTDSYLPAVMQDHRKKGGGSIKWMQLTWRNVTPLAYARRAPIRPAAELG